MTDDVKAAIERLRKSMNTKGMCPWEHPVYQADRRGGPTAAYRLDLEAVFIAEHPADEGEPVTKEWLDKRCHDRTYEEQCFYFFTAIENVDLVFVLYGDAWQAFIEDENENQITIRTDIKTIGQVRLLCRALGITLKEPT